jgi:hypothetical protein
MFARRLLLVLLSLIAMFAVTVLAPFISSDAHAQRKKVVFGEEEEGSVVEGYVHKPEVGYIITRQEQEDLETLQLKESLAPKIVRSLNKTPF